MFWLLKKKTPQSCDERRQMSFRTTEGVGKRPQAVAGPLISPGGANSRKKELWRPIGVLDKRVGYYLAMPHEHTAL